MEHDAVLKILVLLGVPAVFVWTLLLLDWFGRRRDRRRSEHGRSA